MKVVERRKEPRFTVNLEGRINNREVVIVNVSNSGLKVHADFIPENSFISLTTKIMGKVFHHKGIIYHIHETVDKVYPVQFGVGFHQLYNQEFNRCLDAVINNPQSP